MEMEYDICVFGGCALDRMYYKDELGNIGAVPSLLVPGGKGSNQAVAASRAGARVTMISRIGNDGIGKKILENLIYNNIIIHNVEVVTGLDNDYADILIDEKTKDNQIIRHAGAIDSFTADMIEKYKEVLLRSKLIVAQMKAPKEVSIELINFCYENNKPLIVTPCRPAKLKIDEPGNLDLLNKITFITCNEEECKTIFGTNDIEACVSKYSNKLIVTLGENGVMYHNGTEVVKIPAIEVKDIADTTGAGDTFCGNFAAALIDGLPIHEAIVRAQYASSMKIRVKSAQEGMPYKEELDLYISELVDKKD